jgi:hypothetical protein
MKPKKATQIAQAPFNHTNKELISAARSLQAAGLHNLALRCHDALALRRSYVKEARKLTEGRRQGKPWPG